MPGIKAIPKMMQALTRATADETRESEIKSVRTCRQDHYFGSPVSRLQNVQVPSPTAPFLPLSRFLFLPLSETINPFQIAKGPFISLNRVPPA